MARKYVAYLRVSTAEQGRSGLGLEAQQHAVDEFFLHSLGRRLIASYIEIESGKRDDRPELQKALAHCRRAHAVLIVAKLDRLSRDVHFLTGLEKAGVDFVAADMPEANQLTVHILAVVAQAEREMISARTKAALAAAKSRGTKLGNPNGLAAIRRSGKLGLGANAAKQAKADVRAADYVEILQECRDMGLSYQKMADVLNDQGLAAPRGGLWYPASVRLVLLRGQALRAPLAAA